MHCLHHETSDAPHSTLPCTTSPSCVQSNMPHFLDQAIQWLHFTLAAPLPRDCAPSSSHVAHVLCAHNSTNLAAAHIWHAMRTFLSQSEGHNANLPILPF